LGGIWTEGGFTLTLVSGEGAVKYLWNQCSSNFSFPNKFVIVLPCCLLVDYKSFLKQFFNVLLAALKAVFVKTEMRVVEMIKTKEIQSLC
jgi:hypothetical protein